MISVQRANILILQTMTAVRLVASGMRKSSACEQAGITAEQYDYWLAHDNGALESLQKAIIEAEKVRLSQVINAESILLRNMLDNALQPGIPINSQLKVLTYLGRLQKELEQKHGVNSESDEAEAYLLRGPKLRNEESKMVSFNLRPNADGSIDIGLPTHPDIIDRELVDLDEKPEESDPS